MKETNLNLNTPEETQEFQRVMKNVIPHLIGTQNGPVLLAMLAENKPEVDEFIGTYCEKIERGFNYSTTSKDYTANIRKLHGFASKYESVRVVLPLVSDNLVKAKTEADFIKKNPDFLEKLLNEFGVKEQSRSK